MVFQHTYEIIQPPTSEAVESMVLLAWGREQRRIGFTALRAVEGQPPEIFEIEFEMDKDPLILDDGTLHVFGHGVNEAGQADKTKYTLTTRADDKQPAILLVAPPVA
jgi:hypothetical protein